MSNGSRRPSRLVAHRQQLESPPVTVKADTQAMVEPAASGNQEMLSMIYEKLLDLQAEMSTIRRQTAAIQQCLEQIATPAVSAPIPPESTSLEAIHRPDNDDEVGYWLEQQAGSQENPTRPVQAVPEEEPPLDDLDEQTVSTEHATDLSSEEKEVTFDRPITMRAYKPEPLLLAGWWRYPPEGVKKQKRAVGGK